MLEIKNLNLSNRFIYPLLELDKSYEDFLVNCFVFHEDTKLCGDPKMDEYYIYLLFNFTGKLVISNSLGSDYIQDPYLELEDKLRDHPCYYFDYDINKGEYVLFCMKIPSKYLQEYLYFINGRYSRIKHEAYNLITKRYNDPGTKAVLDKDPLAKEQMNKIYGIEIPEGAEILSSIQDENKKIKETFFIKNYESKNNLK